MCDSEYVYVPVCSEDGDKGKRKKWTLDAEEGNRGKRSKNGRKLKKKDKPCMDRAERNVKVGWRIKWKTAW